MRSVRSSLCPILLWTSLLFGALACGDDARTKPADDAGTSSEQDASSANAGADAGPAPDCFEAPKTYLEIINACTDAEKVEKNPELPLLLPDGTLPPLP